MSPSLVEMAVGDTTGTRTPARGLAFGPCQPGRPDPALHLPALVAELSLVERLAVMLPHEQSGDRRWLSHRFLIIHGGYHVGTRVRGYRDGYQTHGNTP